MSDYTVRVTVGQVVSGPGDQEGIVFSPSVCELTWSWGLQPAKALIDWASAQPARELLDPNAPFTILPKALLQIDVGGHTFYGICTSAVPVMGTDGYTLMQEFSDSRELLGWDIAYCAFNISDHRIVNGRWIRRYKHILPWNFNTRFETYTVSPYSARQIMDFLFASPTTEFPWARVYHPVLDLPVYNLDWMTGCKLGQCLLQLSERLGLVFTLMGGRWTLVWAMKGVDANGQPMALPAFPANSDNRRRGQSISGNPSRVRLLGDRDLYQVMNIPMQPDWVSGWQQFYVFDAFVEDIFLHERTEIAVAGVPAGTPYAEIDADNDENAGALLARARAERITVAQYAALRDARDGQGQAFRDFRKFANRARLDMPVAIYLNRILFRAFRFPAGFTFRNRYGAYLNLRGVNVVERSLAQITHDPVSGAMFYDPILSSQPNGYAIARGYQVAQDAFKSLHPEYFNILEWVSAQALWQAVPFNIDNSGEGDQFIVFDEPVIYSADLIVMDETGSYPCANANATISAPPVRAALTFEGETYSYIDGISCRDEVQNISGLHGEHISLGAGWDPVELFYADGTSVNYKAAALMASLLNRQFWYDYGGYVVNGSNATQLSPVIDRVTVRVSEAGLTEEVDWTNERARNVSMAISPITGQPLAVVGIDLERNFDRVAQLAPLLVGQAELREQVNQLRAEAALYLVNPGESRRFVDNFHLLLGLDSVPERVMMKDGATAPDGTVLPMGAPLWREAAGQNPLLPKNDGSVTVVSPVFMGVTVESAQGVKGPVRVTKAGSGGVIFVRVQGPAAVNDGLTMPVDPVTKKFTATDYLVKNTASAPTIAQALEAVGDGATRLIRASVFGGGGGGTQCPYG